VFVDHGLLRLDEAREVMGHVRATHAASKVIHVDASAEFYAALEGVTDPEQKRKIIGRHFVEVFQREAAK
jgi:GMP synthase (glutamine-hydrolysing)